MQAKNSFSAPVLMISVLLLLILTSFIDLSAIQTSGGRDNVYLSVIILQLLILVLPAVFYCKLKGSGYAMTLNIRFFSPIKIFFVVSVMILIVSGISLLKCMLYSYGDIVFITKYSFFDSYMPAGNVSFSDIVYVVLAFAVLPAVTEEFLFRSVLVNEYSSILLTALLYSLMFFSFSEFPIHFLIGIIYGFTVLVTRSVLSSVIIHIGVNAYGIFVEQQIFKLCQQAEDITPLVFILGLIFILSLYFTLNEAERIYYVYAVANSESHESEKIRFTEYLFSPTFLLCIVVFVIGTLGT